MKKHGFLLMLFATGCGSGGGGGGTTEKVEGTVSIGGKPAKVTSCKAIKGTYGEAEFVQLEVGLDSGHTVILDAALGNKLRKGSETVKLDCQGKGGGGSYSVLPKPWATGAADLTCPTADGELVLHITYDCGATDRPSNRK